MSAILVSLFMAGVMYGQSGEVFVDANSNGVKDKGEKGLSGVVVSDGFTLVKSDSRGEFSIQLADRSRFVTLYTPSGYRHTTPIHIDVREGCRRTSHLGLFLPMILQGSLFRWPI